MEKLLEEKILASFKKKLGKEAKGLDLFVAISPDCWSDWENTYTCEVMEKQDNGKVWSLECTKSGNIKDYYQLG